MSCWPSAQIVANESSNELNCLNAYFKLHMYVATDGLQEMGCLF